MSNFDFLARMNDKLRWVEDRTKRNQDVDYSTYWLKPSCSCPPDTNIYIRGGWCHNQNRNVLYWQPAGTVEFGIGGDNECGAFTNPNYYAAVVFGWSVTWPEPSTTFNTYYALDPPGYVTVSEFVTAAEAETAALDNILMVLGVAGSTWISGIAILRNDGIVGVKGHILPIDAVNRGRSYLWRDDLRPRYGYS